MGLLAVTDINEKFMADSVQPIVSVAMICFNQEYFIREALVSVLAQELPFPIEVVIGDDASTDATLGIVHDVLDRSEIPSKIIARKKNIGYQRNFLDVISQCRGKYIAILEGDDLWISNCKLASQVQCLETSDCASACVHDGIVFEDSLENGVRFSGENSERQLNLHDVLGSWIAPTASILFRRDILNPLPEWFSEVKSVDYALLLCAADQGDLRYLPIIASAYRRHGGGVSSKETTETWLDNMASVYFYFSLSTKTTLGPKIRSHASRIWATLAGASLRARKLHCAIRYLRRASRAAYPSPTRISAVAVTLVIAFFTNGKWKSENPYWKSI